MSKSVFNIRLMQAEDFDAVVGIDAKIVNSVRSGYFEMKFDVLFESRDYLPASLVAEREDGTVVGFVMGTLYVGEFGIFEEQATLDTLGVAPEYQNQGVGMRLMDEFMDHLKSLGVKKVSTLVSSEDANLTRFFTSNRFEPSRTIHLERKI
ncbi:MAG: GNAT family N-acetyltransferase [Polyangiaceae bacterium]|nr:GNAT family N-acetyltransferase [Polyangiaceae bacterium]